MAKRGKGEGTIFYSKPLGRWIAQCNLGYKDNGKLNRKTVSGKTRNEVKNKLLELQSLIASGKCCRKDTITFKGLLKEITDDKFKSNIIQETTYARTQKTIKRFGAFGDLEIQRITYRDVQKFLNSQTKYASCTISKTYSLMNNIFNYAIKRNIINSNPMDLVMKPKTTKLPKQRDFAFTIEEEMLILDNLENEKYRNIFMIAFHTGMRIGEILALTVEDIDFENKLININKTLTKDLNDKVKVGDRPKTSNGVRIIPYIDKLEPYLKDAVANYKRNKYHLLFTNATKEPITPSTITSSFKRICKNLGIGVKPLIIDRTAREGRVIHSQTSDVFIHMTRHTYATRCIESGMPPVVLQKLLGHHDVSITLNTYTSVFNKFQKDSLKSYVDYMNNLNA